MPLSISADTIRCGDAILLKVHLPSGGRHDDDHLLLRKQPDIICIHGLHPWRVMSGPCLSSNSFRNILH